MNEQPSYTPAPEAPAPSQAATQPQADSAAAPPETPIVASETNTPTRPTWLTVVGIVLIVLGALLLLQSLGTLAATRPQFEGDKPMVVNYAGFVHSILSILIGIGLLKLMRLAYYAYLVGAVVITGVMGYTLVQLIIGAVNTTTAPSFEYYQMFGYLYIALSVLYVIYLAFIIFGFIKLLMPRSRALFH